MAPTPLTESEISTWLGKLPGWERDGGMIKKTYHFDHYLAGVAFAAAAGTVCEGQGHHPDLFIGYKRVEVGFTTHDAGHQITEKDVKAAAAIEALGYPRS